jgi:hypothetical protein
MDQNKTQDEKKFPPGTSMFVLCYIRTAARNTSVMKKMRKGFKGTKWIKGRNWTENTKNPGRRNFICSPKRPHRPWGPLSLLSTHHVALSPVTKQPGREVNHSSPLSYQVKNSRITHPLLLYAFMACIGTTLPSLDYSHASHMARP